MKVPSPPSARPTVALLLVTLSVAGCATGNRSRDTETPPAHGVTPLFSMIEASFIGLAEKMPADRYDFRPTDGDFEGVRTFAEQVKHVACSNFAFFNQIEDIAPPDDCASGGPHPAAGKPELVEYLRESFAYAVRVIGAMTAENAFDPVSGPYGGEWTRLGMTTMGVWHATDHYGQIVVYARMNGVVPGG